MVARSTRSGEGSQRSSPRPTFALAVSIGALISPHHAPADVGVDRPRQLDCEGVAGLGAAWVEGAGAVLGAVVVGGGEGAVLQAGESDGAELRESGRQGVAPYSVAKRLGAVAVPVIAVGSRDRLTELHEAPVHLVGDRRALAGLVADRSPTDGIEDDEEGALPVELLAARADEGSHPLHQALLAPRQQDPYLEVRGRVGIELLRGGEDDGDAGGVVIRARDDVGQLDVREQEDADEEDDRGEELEQREEARIHPRHPSTEDREEDGKRPEQHPERAERDGRALGEPGGARDALGLEGGAGAGGVVVGAEEEAGGSVRALAGRDDVLGRAPEEEPAQEGEAGGDVQGRGIIQGRPAPPAASAGSVRCGGWDSNPQALSGTAF